jgi:oligopeptide/dipeptide ABC transporter ATP-binding protein
MVATASLLYSLAKQDGIFRQRRWQYKKRCGATASESGYLTMLLSVEDLAVRFQTEEGTVHAVNRVSFELDAAETLAIVGESGCGKSATSLAIMGLLPRPYAHISSGRILFGGTDLVGLPERRMRALRGQDISMVFQDPMTSLNPVLTIGRQLTEAFVAHKRRGKAAATSNAIDLLKMVGIADPAEVVVRYPHQLSGGMRQRVMLAIALALAPKLLIADEPTTALDVTIQAQVLELIRELTRQSGTAVLLITHNLGVVASMTQRVLVMYAGFVVETAPTRAIFAQPRHPYTVGLLHSLPRFDEDARQDLVAIEGAPPDQFSPARGCPFAPRCAWRMAVCWRENPLLRTAAADVDPLAATHQAACHNPVTSDEARAGRPLRPDFQPASAPIGRGAI